MRRSKLKVVLLSASSALLWLTTPASAFEREWHLGGGVGFASVASGYGNGVAFGVHGAYGISDVFDARLELAGSQHSYDVAGVEKQTQILSAAALLAYKIDVISWVPYLGAGLGYYHFFDEPPPGSAFRSDDVGLATELGIDYAVSRNFGLGVGARFDMPFNDLGAARYFALLARGEYRWGW